MTRAFASLLIFAIVAVPVLAQNSNGTGSGATAPDSKANDTNPEIEKLKQKIERLKYQNQLFKEKLENELQSIQAEQKRLESKQQLEDVKQKKDLSSIENKKEQIEAELGLKSTRQKQELSDVKNRIEELQTELELASQKTEKAIQDAINQKKKLESKLDLRETKKDSELADLKMKLKEEQVKQRLAMTESKLLEARLQKKKLQEQIELAELESKQSEMTAEIHLRQTRRKWKSEVNKPIDYIENPLQDKTLYVTDRRVRLDGPIISETGDWVSKRLHYFNNQSDDKPIFIIINDSPGGSVIEGFRIMETMKSISAPVYVVVRERAASMAAAITTLADRSFAYADAIILHHEIQASMGGSLKEQEAQLEMMKKWWKRLAGPIADKMNMSLENFRKRLYEEDPNGNWQEFATEAKDLNWVDHIIENIQDVGVREEPDETPPSPTFFFLKKESDRIRQDEQGNYYRKLPPLRPFDFYYMYDPNNNYRW
jgi:ATP-dependent Clp protease protease subunit